MSISKGFISPHVGSSHCAYAASVGACAVAASFSWTWRHLLSASNCIGAKAGGHQLGPSKPGSHRQYRAWKQQPGPAPTEYDMRQDTKTGSTIGTHSHTFFRFSGKVDLD